MKQDFNESFNPRFFKALCDPSRLSVLLNLAKSGEPVTVTEIGRKSPINLSVVSRHLATLRDAGILEARKCGKEVYYSIRFDELLYNLRSIIETIESFQESQTYLEQLHFKEKSISDTDKIRASFPISFNAKNTNLVHSDLLSVSEIGGLPTCSTVNQGLKLSKRSARALFHAFGGELPVATGTIGSGDIVLDLDYNAVDDLKLIAKKVGHKGHVDNIENTDEFVKNTKNELYEEGLTNVDVRKGFIENLPFDVSTFDYLVSNRPINITSSLANVFAEIRRVLKPGGTAFIADITVEELPEWTLSTEQLNGSYITGAIGEKEYIEGFRQAGFVTILERERQILSSAEINSIISNYIDESINNIGIYKAEHDRSTESIIEAISGKIFSIVFSVRKPL
ncbi:metalloregulator ArsR/SmtB family transcription factor [bacterium]|nr:metalloregulator ArsR/SmtB family transcription factor [bacterium]